MGVGTDLFSEVFDFPDPDAQRRYAELVGVDSVKDRLVNEAILLLDRELVKRWSDKHHGQSIPAVKDMGTRPPLIILAGDVGTGKTEIAETFLDAVTRRMRASGTLYALSLTARGQGAVGQMSTLIGSAFKTLAEEAGSYRDGNPRKISVLMVDEGDSLAQSRESSSMHHEDRAGVNALIKGIDSLRRENIAAIVVLCTNRLSAIDPAVRRRAAVSLSLVRPDEVQRRALFSNLLQGVALTDEELTQLVNSTGVIEGREYGYTYSDIRQRLIPEAVIIAISHDVPLSYAALTEAVNRISPTRPFAEVEE